MEKTNLKMESGKQKRKAEATVSEPKNIRLSPTPLKTRRIDSPTKLKSLKKKKKPKTKQSLSEKVVNLTTENKPEAEVTILQATAKKSIDKKKPHINAITNSSENYPILRDRELIDKFMKVPLTNNQKGRIRQAIKAQLQSSEATLFPDIINGKIQAILKSSENLTDSDLKRIRILHNMLKTSLEKAKAISEETPKKVKKPKKDKKNKEKEDKEPLVQKVKGPKRYVVFLGNLPLDISKDKIMAHFAEINEHIKDIRIQKPGEGKKKAFAYVELSNEPSFELALSKHHSMMGSHRINVLYTTQQKSKITKAEAKSKTAKLIALQKSGKLVGSLPMSKKRSHRRMILKQARAKAEATANSSITNNLQMKM